MDITKFYPNENERPLDTLKPDGGFCGIFRTIACVGDSLSSGEFESLDAWKWRSIHDMYEYSWGQYMARATGATVYNFSKGGMTAKEYMETFHEKRDIWNPELAAQAYVIALGYNDIVNCNWEIGSVDDIDRESWEKNKKTFIGYYAQIIQRYKEIQPRAKFFLTTIARENKPSDERMKRHAEAIYALAEYFGENMYVIDLYRDMPPHDEEFKRNFYMGDHLTPAGYLLAAQVMMTYIDYIIRNNPHDFKEVAFIGTQLKYYRAEEPPQA